MIAFLGMYDLPHARTANDRLWAAIRQHLGHGPEDLTRSTDPWTIWTSPDLLLAQTCGLPYRAKLHDRVTLVGTPSYDLPDCPPGQYLSYLIKRRDDPRDLAALARNGRFAFNDPLSQSGWAAPLAHMAQHGLAPDRLLETGGHQNSVLAVLRGKADFAAIDAVTLLMIGDDDPDAMAFLKVFNKTDPTPGLPFITEKGRDPGPIAAAIEKAIDALARSDRLTLRLNGLVQIPIEAYLDQPIPPAPGEG